MATFNEKVTAAQDFITTRGADVTTSGTIAALANTGTSYLRTTLCTTLQGLVADASGKRVILENANTVSMTVANESGSATAANRITTGTGADFTLAAGASIELVYDSTAARWHIVNGTGNTGDVVGPSSAVDKNIATFNSTTGKLIQDGGFNIAQVTNASPDDVSNASVALSVTSNALTIALKDKSGSNPSATSPVAFSFRNATLTTPTWSVVSATAAQSITIPSSATLGLLSLVPGLIYVYEINNAGTPEMAVAACPFDENGLVSTTAISAAATSNTTLYSTTARTNVACRLVAIISTTQTTIGTWVLAEITSVSPNFLNTAIAKYIQVLFNATPRSDSIKSGTYLPTFSGLQNLSATTAYNWQYIQVGDVVTVSGRFDADAVIVGATEFLATLPVTVGVFSSGTEQCAGCFGSGASQAGSVSPNNGAALAAFDWNSNTTANASFWCSWTYRIIR